MIYAPRSFAMERFCFALIKPLRHGFAVPPPLSRGGFGMAESPISSPEAPLLGELSSDSETERLYGGEPDREPQRNETSPSRLRRATSPIEGRPWHTGKLSLFARGSPR